VALAPGGTGSIRLPGQIGGRIGHRRRQWLDPALAVLTFAATASYLAALPLSLGHPDEAHYLHEAKRLLAGERLYRDVFELATPGWMYLMALLFRVFGVTLATARITAAVIHAATAAVLFIVCRRLTVRRGLALACAGTYVVVCPAAWPVASQHWLASLLSVVMLLLCLRPLGASMSFSLGFVVGLAIAVHQARGIAMGSGVAAFLTVDAFLQRRNRQTSGTVLALAFAGGLLLAVLPLLGVVVARAGLESVWRALVMHPLHSYRSAFGCRWGKHGGPAFSVRGLLQYIPLTLICIVPRLGSLWRRGYDRECVRPGAVLIVLALSSIVSILYYPDYIHIAFIAPLFFVVIADGVEHLLRALPSRVEVGIGWAATLVIFCVISLQLQLFRDAAVRATRTTVTYQSAFGPVEMSPHQIPIYDKLRDLLGATPSRTLYCHPMSSYNYLLLDARNPTRFEFVNPGSYSTPAQIDEVIDVLRTGEVPLVLMRPAYKPRRKDPISEFIREHYEPVPDEMLRRWGLWRLQSSRGARLDE
jgi:hypothetical protein